MSEVAGTAVRSIKDISKSLRSRWLTPKPRAVLLFNKMLHPELSKRMTWSWLLEPSQASAASVLMNVSKKHNQKIHMREGGILSQKGKSVPPWCTLAFMWDMWAPTSLGKKTTQISSMWCISYVAGWKGLLSITSASSSAFTEVFHFCCFSFKCLEVQIFISDLTRCCSY